VKPSPSGWGFRFESDRQDSSQIASDVDLQFPAPGHSDDKLSKVAGLGELPVGLFGWPAARCSTSLHESCLKADTDVCASGPQRTSRRMRVAFDCAFRLN